MPTYDYECQSCGHGFEQFQRISEAPLETCPQCGGRVRRLLGTGAGILFKGSGFYATDYRSESYRKAAKTEGEKASSPPAAAKTDSAGTGTGPSGGGAKPGSEKG